MMIFSVAIDCETCGHRMTIRVGDLSAAPDGEPTFYLDTFSQMTFTCDNCGGQTYTGDLEDETWHEPGTLPEDEEE